jgi:hypothetical protein
MDLPRVPSRGTAASYGVLSSAARAFCCALLFLGPAVAAENLGCIEVYSGIPDEHPCPTWAAGQFQLSAHTFIDRPTWQGADGIVRWHATLGWFMAKKGADTGAGYRCVAGDPYGDTPLTCGGFGGESVCLARSCGGSEATKGDL